MPNPLLSINQIMGTTLDTEPRANKRLIKNMANVHFQYVSY